MLSTRMASLAETSSLLRLKLHRFSSRMAFAVRILQQAHVLATKVRSGSWSVEVQLALKACRRLQLSQLST